MSSARHLLQVFKITSITSENLPCLKHIKLKLELDGGLDGSYWEHADSAYEDGHFIFRV